MASRDVAYSADRHRDSESSSGLRKFCRSVYNPDNKAILGRTGSSWAKIGAFYIVFYAGLAGFFSLLMFVFFQTLDDIHPTMMGMYSLIKNNPGMGFRPQPDVVSTLVKYSVSTPSTYSDYVGDIVSYLKDNGYINDKYQPSDIKTDGNGKAAFDISTLDAACSINISNVNSSYGYSDGKPCVLLKINKIYEWMPEAFDNESLSSEKGEEAQKALDNRFSYTDIGISCEGENDGDTDALGQVDFFPRLGFPLDYFPYLNAANYRSPIVFAKFQNIKRGVLIQIWCKMWAKNVMHHKNDKAGSVRFELMIDN